MAGLSCLTAGHSKFILLYANTVGTLLQTLIFAPMSSEEPNDTTTAPPAAMPVTPAPLPPLSEDASAAFVALAARFKDEVPHNDGDAEFFMSVRDLDTAINVCWSCRTRIR
jgi:hypothetical protein